MLDPTLAQILNHMLDLERQVASLREEIEMLKRPSVNGNARTEPWVDPLETMTPSQQR